MLPRSLATCVSAPRYSRACWGLSRRPLLWAPSRLKSTPAAALVEENTAVEAPPHDNNHKDELDLTFWDHEAAFKSKTTSEVLRALFIFKLCGIPYLVKNNEKVRGQPRGGRRRRRELQHVTLLTENPVRGSDPACGPPWPDLTRRHLESQSRPPPSKMEYHVLAFSSQNDPQKRRIGLFSHASVHTLPSHWSAACLSVCLITFNVPVSSLSKLPN